MLTVGYSLKGNLQKPIYSDPKSTIVQVTMSSSKRLATGQHTGSSFMSCQATLAFSCRLNPKPKLVLQVGISTMNFSSLSMLNLTTRCLYRQS